MSTNKIRLRSFAIVAGASRDLLCDTCNLMLGHAKESPEILRAGAKYLEDHALR
jgi:hypothetical protein